MFYLFGPDRPMGNRLSAAYTGPVTGSYSFDDTLSDFHLHEDNGFNA
jgi:hypothetical protein